MKRYLVALIALLAVAGSFAMEVVDLNCGWRFKKGVELRTMNEGDAVDLPHTWNVTDAMFGGDYHRGTATYSRMLDVPLSGSPQRYFLRVNAAQSVADVYVDNKWIGQHRGGYTAFVIELTPYVTGGKSHKIDIRVNNSQVSDAAPISGDFNIFGGLNRGVELLITGETCISPDFYGSPGVFFAQKKITKEKAEIDVTAMVSSVDKKACKREIIVNLHDCDSIVAHGKSEVGSDGVARLSLTLRDPHLWDGIDDPFMYKGEVILLEDGVKVDDRSVDVGLRFYHADPDHGFFLNGRPYRLNGANLHQDRAERASAYRDTDFDEDIALALDMGCNALRLAHYPHSEKMYSRMDRHGLVAWTEIPFVNVFISNPEYAENLRQQLKELIYQNYNHPSILTWGLFNEVNSGWMEPVGDMVAELDSLAKVLDPTRQTVGASNQNEEFNGYPDYIAFNKYFGWYGDNPADMASWIDAEHKAHPERAMGISEYGAGASVFQQSDSLIHPEPWGQWHPENWQTYYHIENWKILKAREYLWCNFIWCLADFSSAGRKEGDTFGRNDKGLVTYDRATKKDAYYFYKANWNKQSPVLYIAGRRNIAVKSPVIDVTVFGNRGAAELKVNGRSYGSAIPDEVNTMIWRDIPLRQGDNEIVVTDSVGSDSCIKILK